MIFRRLRTGGDEGAALVMVVGTMIILSLFVLTSLTLVVNSTRSGRTDQDARRAYAAAQAGVDDFIARSNSNDTYYRNVNSDATNVAAVTTAAAPRGATVPGSATNDETFTYQMLSSVTEVAQTGTIRLEVTGYATNNRGTVSRKVIANLKPDSFLNYIYVTDYEVQDPALYDTNVYLTSTGSGSNTTRYYANPAQVRAKCRNYYYDGRPSVGSTINASDPNTQLWYKPPSASAPQPYSGPNFNGQSYSIACNEIQWGGTDVVQGPLHSNDSLKITGPVRFTSTQTETSWNTSPADGHLWWGGYSSNLPANQPVYAAPLALPNDNSELVSTATTADGCTYTGATKITLVGDKMQVWSPSTVAATANAKRTCLGNNKNQMLDVPKVIYVKDVASCTPAAGTGTSGVGYPLPTEDPNYSKFSPDFPCAKGDAYVQGTLTGGLTIGSTQDIVITGDLKYTSGTSGSDVLGLIPTRNAWVYHPVDGNGVNIATFTPVFTIQAAILTLQDSFLVQNYDTGLPLSVNGNPLTSLNVIGSISQRFRGPVGTGSATAISTGYSKNYVWDSRLPANPPPYFLKPVSSPWYLDKLTDE